MKFRKTALTIGWDGLGGEARNPKRKQGTVPHSSSKENDEQLSSGQGFECEKRGEQIKHISSSDTENDD